MYRRRLEAQGAARKGISAYRYQLRVVLQIAERHAGRLLTCAELFQSPHLLGRVLVDDEGERGAGRLSKWTLAQRRSALRSFAALMRPELLPLLGEEPHAVLDRALRGAAERVGAGYRLTGGAPRRRGGDVPAPDEVAAVLDALGRGPGYVGARDRAFFAILAQTGARVNALRELDGADCVLLPSGRVRVFLHEKGTGEPREVELSHHAVGLLRDYADAFNRHAAVHRWAVRVRLGEAGAVWRNSARGRWDGKGIRASLRAGCSEVGIPAFTPHALRRAFATSAASGLPRHVVAQAGGWQGLERLDDHYVRPHPATIWEKLASGTRSSQAAGPLGSELRDAARVP